MIEIDDKYKFLILGSDKTLHRRDLKLITEIILHCSDSDKPEHDDVDVIRSWHKALGFSDVGYHFFIKKDGLIQLGRNINKVGAHCVTQNIVSIGICLSGRHAFTETQYKNAHSLITKLMANYSIKKDKVFPHSYFNENKTCPNFNLLNIWKFDNI